MHDVACPTTYHWRIGVSNNELGHSEPHPRSVSFKKSTTNIHKPPQTSTNPCYVIYSCEWDPERLFSSTNLSTWYRYFSTWCQSFRASPVRFVCKNSVFAVHSLAVEETQNGFICRHQSPKFFVEHPLAGCLGSGSFP